MNAKPPEMDTRDPLDRQDSRSPRKPYTPPRLTKHGSIVTHTGPPPAPSQISSDRALKEGLAPVDPRQVLAEVVKLPLTTWSYQGEAVRHLGPMAQDFAAAFGVGADDRHINLIDANGVALAALQALHQLVERQQAEVAALTRRVAGLEAENRALWAEVRSRHSEEMVVESR